jgi:hypothetical protein
MKEEAKSYRRLSVGYFHNSTGWFFEDGEEGTKGGKEDARHRVNLAGTMNIIPSGWHPHLPTKPQDQSS